MSDVLKLKELAKGVSVLYAEDDQDVQDAFARNLERIFDDVRVVSNGLEGLESYKQKRVDLIITDNKMPKMDGMMMMEEILKINPAQRYVITSGYSEHEEISEPIYNSATAYLIKPISLDNFVKTMIEVVQAIKSSS